MSRAKAKAILHLLDVAIAKGLYTQEGNDALNTATHWLHDLRAKKGGLL